MNQLYQLRRTFHIHIRHHHRICPAVIVQLSSLLWQHDITSRWSYSARTGHYVYTHIMPYTPTHKNIWQAKCHYWCRINSVIALMMIHKTVKIWRRQQGSWQWWWWQWCWWNNSYWFWTRWLCFCSWDDDDDNNNNNNIKNKTSTIIFPRVLLRSRCVAFFSRCWTSFSRVVRYSNANSLTVLQNRPTFASRDACGE